MKGKLLLVLSIVLALVFFLILSYRENSVKPRSSYKTSAIKGFHLARKAGDRIKWELTAESADFQEGNNEIFLSDITVKIYQEKEIILTGGKGNYSVQEKLLEIGMPVEITMDGSVLTTNSLTWHGEDEVMTTRDNVSLKGKNFLMQGKGLTVNVSDRKVKVLKDVQGIFYR
ncbi:MAG: LPS export ABC transporter periplasmic protein LptC [Nitrospirae bacterium]|nr:LPS export ABC transporter periplasmic protein LptC [Nitrospirota bacterium]